METEIYDETMATRVALHPFLAGMNRAQLALLTDCAMSVRFKPGDIILREGDRADRLFLIETGKVVLESGKAIKAFEAGKANRSHHEVKRRAARRRHYFDARGRSQHRRCAAGYHRESSGPRSWFRHNFQAFRTYSESAMSPQAKICGNLSLTQTSSA